MTLSLEEKECKREERRKKKFYETHKEINGEVYKICSKCNEWFPCNENYFYKNKANGIDGLNPHCINCAKKRSTKWQQQNPEKYKKVRDKYRSKPESRIKNIIRVERWRNKGKQREWQRNHPESMLMYADRRGNKKHTISKIEWEDCKKYFNHRCAYCNIKIEEHWIKFKGEEILGDFHKDHVNHEGANDISNCVPACKKCNVQKNVLELVNWYDENNPNFKQERLNKINKWIYEDCKKYIKQK